MKRKFLTPALLALLSVKTFAFCGFYVAKAGSQLFNNKSEVILVRDGLYTTITMSNDFQGDIKDFAMVVPVPSVLNREDIRIVERSLFQTLDDYSSPRLVEYYDVNPCAVRYDYDKYKNRSIAPSMEMESVVALVNEENEGVTIEARYEVDEYEILILSAEESTGLKQWLDRNGYKVPEQAAEVLEPYIKDKLKFFVVKVNLNKYNPQQNGGYLRPIQIKVKTDRFMLPIRLGMANSTGEQDMIVYAFTKSGRIESTNYRTVKIPSNKNVPTFIKSRFGEFYGDLYTNYYNKEGKNALFLEYAWNVTPSYGNVKCDPCVGNPPYYNDFNLAGVNWVNNPSEPIFFTRLHVRYTREQFPEDLFFQVTPNTENFQARYIITHPATGDLQCDEAQTYLKDLRARRMKELLQMGVLSAWDPVSYTNYIYTGNGTPSENEEGEAFPLIIPKNPASKLPKLIFGLTLFLLGVFIANQLKRKYNLSNI